MATQNYFMFPKNKHTFDDFGIVSKSNYDNLSLNKDYKSNGDLCSKENFDNVKQKCSTSCSSL